MSCRGGSAEEAAMFEDPKGPIERFEWGTFVIAGKRHGEGGQRVGKDVRVIGSKVSEWKERKGHVLTPAMVTCVYDRGIDTLVIGVGVYGALECPSDVKAAIADHGISDLRILPTPAACREYNALVRAGRKVALLAHGTC